MKIAICGSMSFLTQMEELQYQLQALGHQVVVPKFFEGEQEKMAAGATQEERDAFKNQGFRYYFDVITNSDAIVVANYTKNDIENYIGGNAFMEIGVAYYLRKKIFYLNPVPEMLYTDELTGVQPVVLNGDLSAIA